MTKKEKIICYCFGITHEYISNYIIANNIKTLDSLAEQTKITKACNACRNEVLELLESLNKN